jgi:hypothetical protein
VCLWRGQNEFGSWIFKMPRNFRNILHGHWQWIFLQTKGQGQNLIPGLTVMTRLNLSLLNFTTIIYEINVSGWKMGQNDDIHLFLSSEISLGPIQAISQTKH